jgi:hypothetical protein
MTLESIGFKAKKDPLTGQCVGVGIVHLGVLTRRV